MSRSTDFAKRYYRICSRFPLRGVPACRFGKTDVTRILTGIERSSGGTAGTTTFGIDTALGEATLHVGFAIQTRSMVEFGFFVEVAGKGVGSNYAVIALEATKASGGAIPNPPYPRPLFYTLDELREILTEFFSLADALLALVRPSLAGGSGDTHG